MIKEYAKKYMEDLIHNMGLIQVRLQNGQNQNFSEGFEQAFQLITTQTGAGNKLMFIGNGASASIASHMATDYWKNGGVRAVAFNDSSLLTCVSNDYGYARVFEKPIEMFADPGDVLMAISSSGESENILRGARAAREAECRIITFSGFKENNPLSSLGDLNFYVPSPSYGPVEIIHLSICHALCDALITHKPRLPKPRLPKTPLL
ncbi:MAG: SIS domain-containing protein [Nitrospinaceae bacterium]